jgi:hypothetical protein
MNQSANKLTNSLLSALSDRQREIIVGRYGLEKSGRAETLAALGARFKITRERVRQIQVGAMALVKDRMLKDPNWRRLIAKGEKFLKDGGGAVRDREFLAEFQPSVPGISLNHLNFIAEATGGFNFHREDRDFHSFFYLDKPSFKAASGFLEQWTALLKSKKKEVLAKNKYQELLEDFLKRKDIKPAWAANYLSISKKVGRNPYGDHGLTEWAEIAPKTIRDRVYLVLKKKKEPMHFQAIAQTVAETFAGRRVSPPTVHNELIKDGRFVLVGRGMYALREHGYEPGTAREVIKRILKKHGPLRPREIILAVQKERFFKPNTVLVNLQNKAHFARLADGTYKIREA